MSLSNPPRLLAVAQMFPPAAAVGVLRPLRLIRHLAGHGWTTTVLVASPSTYTAGVPIDPALVENVPANVRIIRAPVIRVAPPIARVLSPFRRTRQSITHEENRPRGDGVPESTVPQPSLIKRAYLFVDELTTIPDREAGWIAPAVARALADIAWRRPDVIYSTAPPWTAQVVALLVAKMTGLPWVADFRDPWARAPWRESQPQRIRRACIRLERQVVERVDAILFATRTNRDEYAAHYGADLARKFHVVPNGCDIGDFAGIRAQPPSDRIVMVHAGSLYGARSPVPLFRAIAASIRDGSITRERFQLRLIGASAADNFSAAAAELGLSDVVEFVPRMKRQEVISAMASASCLLVLQPGTTVSIPGKLYEYLAVGRPILSLSEEGELSDLVRRSGIGVAVVPHDPLAIDAGLRQVIALARKNELPRVATELYDGDRPAEQAAAIIRKVADSSPARVPVTSETS
jgi:glycosyltransferase involved in cell wall biosynthesis